MRQNREHGYSEQWEKDHLARKSSKGVIMEPKENIWFEHWLAVGSISAEARSKVYSVGGKVEDVHPQAGPHLVLVCLPYDESGNDDRILRIKSDAAGKTVTIDVICSDTSCNIQLVISTSTGVEALFQESINDLVMVTESEWFDIDHL